jgi:hypothetical protein
MASDPARRARGGLAVTPVSIADAWGCVPWYARPFGPGDVPCAVPWPYSARTACFAGDRAYAPRDVCALPRAPRPVDTRPRPVDTRARTLVTRRGPVRYRHREDGAIVFVRLARVSASTPLRLARGVTCAI